MKGLSTRTRVMMRPATAAVIVPTKLLRQLAPDSPTHLLSPFSRVADTTLWFAATRYHVKR